MGKGNMKSADPYHRNSYVPEYHRRHKQEYELWEKVYLARYKDYDGEKMMSAALERPAYIIVTMVTRMKESGEWELYRSLSEEEFEKIMNASERRDRHEQGKRTNISTSCNSGKA